jgi:hypothetical protein
MKWCWWGTWSWIKCRTFLSCNTFQRFLCFLLIIVMHESLLFSTKIISTTWNGLAQRIVHVEWFSMCFTWGSIHFSVATYNEPFVITLFTRLVLHECKKCDPKCLSWCTHQRASEETILCDAGFRCWAFSKQHCCSPVLILSERTMISLLVTI